MNILQLVITSIMILVLMVANVSAGTTRTIDELHDMRETFIENFRQHGQRDENKAKQIESDLQQLIKVSEGKVKVRALFELATIQRINNKFESAIKNFEFAVKSNKAARDTELGFNIWLGIARSHAYGTRDHGAAAKAFTHAVKTAGDNPTDKQQYEMADYSSQLQSGRGELEPALLNALEAIELSRNDSELFYAYLDTGDVLQKFAESCDYRKIIDAKTFSEEDEWGACKRAVASAESYYEKARLTANKLGWHFLEKESRGFISRLKPRLFLIDSKASFEKIGSMGIFNAQDEADVLVNDNFFAGGSELGSELPISGLINEVVPKEHDDPRSNYLRGIKSDLSGNSAEALEFFTRAANMLNTERSSMFDVRRRGAVIENRPELYRDLGLRLLAFGQQHEAFSVFETIRSRGLDIVASALTKNQFTGPELIQLAKVVQLDSLISARQNLLVETTIASMEQKQTLVRVNELKRLKEQFKELHDQKKTKSILAKLAAVEFSAPGLEQLRKKANTENVPVILYWVTHTNVLVWVVSSDKVEVKTVFLPEVALVDKVRKLVDSLQSAQKEFDRTSAKELYAYLLAPFMEYLNAENIIVIPQGPLVGLPFEVLIDAKTDKYLMQSKVVSYAPNAAFAIKMLDNTYATPNQLTAIYDESVNIRTGEIGKITNIPGIEVKALSTKKMGEDELLQNLSSSRNVHVLLHGSFNNDDPLQSSITLAESAHSRQHITAAQLLSVVWRNTHLAVFSSCEGANLKTRISNEIFGIAWTLLAGGVQNIVLSRWEVNEVSNAFLMGQFYKHLSGGVKPSVALNRSVRDMLVNKYQHPYYWAAPQVFGQ